MRCSADGRSATSFYLNSGEHAGGIHIAIQIIFNLEDM
jgi:hypothetical protein